MIEKDEFVVIEFSEGLREKVHLIAPIVDINVELVEVKFLKLSHLSQTFSEKNEKNGFVKKEQIVHNLLPPVKLRRGDICHLI